MFKLQRSKAEKSGEKFDFSFFQFQATRVPLGWDKIVVSIISMETGKAVARTNKALVRSGSCQWSEAVSESVHFLQEDASKEPEEKLFKFVVTMGSARSGILGEAIINLADYLSSKFPVSISLPLKKCNQGTVLTVKIQCLNPRAGSRKSERCKEGAIEQDDRNSVSDDTDNRSEGSDHILAGSVGSSSGSHLGYGFQRTKDGASSPATSRHSSDSAEFLSSGSSTANSLPRRQDSSGSRDGSVTNRIGNGQDSYKSSPSSFNGMGTGAMINLQKQWQERSTQGSQGSIENVNRGMHSAAPMRGNDHSKGSLEAAEVTIQELRKEATMWERNARKSGAEVDTLKHQFAEQTKHYSDLKMEFSAAQAEKDRLKSELEQLNSVVQAFTERGDSLDKARFEADDAKRTVSELQEEIELLKQSNTNLDIQLRKTQESNMELVSVLQELEETIEQKNVEIDKFSEEREKIGDLEALRQELERLKQQKESEAQLSLADAERDSLNKEVEQLRSALQASMASHGIAETASREAENGKFIVQKLQEEVETEKESNNSLNLQLKKTEESYKHLLSVVQVLEERLKEQERQKENLSNFEASAAREENKCGILDAEAEWMQKLSSKDEEIRKLEAQIYHFQIQKSSMIVTEDSVESQEDLHKALEISRREMDELERDCKELTDENMELIFKLNKLNKILESKNISIPEVEDYRNVQNYSTIQLKDAADKATGVQCELDYSLKKIADLEADNKRMKDGLVKEAAERKNAESLISNLHQINEDLERGIQKMEAEQLQAFSQVSEHDEHVSRLQQQLDSYAYREKHLEGTIQQLEDVNVELQSEIQILKEHHTNKSGIQELEIQLSVLREETQALRSSKHEYEMQVSNLQMDKEDLEHKLEITQEESKATRVHLDDLGQELARLTVSMESQMSAKKIIEKKSMELERNKEELESHLMDLEVENVQLSERISGLEAQLRYITEEREYFRLDVENTKSHCTDLQSDLHRLELELREEIVELQKSLRESEDKFSGALKESESYKRENRLLQLKLDNMMKEYAESKAKHEEQTLGLSVSRANLEEQLQELTEHFSSSTKQVKSLESEKATLWKDMVEKERVWSVEKDALLVSSKEQEQKLVRAEEALSQVQLEKVSTVECLQNEVQRLTEQMSSTYDEKESMATKALIEASELRAEKVKLEDALQQIQVKVRHCEMELSSVRQDYESKVQLLILQLSASKVKEEEMNVRLEDMKFGEASSSERIQGLEKMIKLLETENQKLEEERDGLTNQAHEAVNLKAEMDILRSTIEDVGREKSRLESSLHFIDAELERVKAEKASLMEKLETMKAAISEREEVKRSKAALEDKLLRLQSELSTKEASIAHEAEQKNESIRLKRLNSQFQRKLQVLQEEREESQSKLKSLEEELQLKANALSKAEQKVFGMSTSKVACASPSRDSKELAELRNKLQFVEGELESLTKEFEVKERDLDAKIEYLENVNRQLTQAQKEFSRTLTAMAAQNQLEMGSVTAVSKLQNPSRGIHEGSNVEDHEDGSTGRCRTRVPVVSILASLPCKFKSFRRVLDHSAASPKAQKSMEGEKDEEAGSFDHSNQGGWKTMPFIIGNEACEKLATIGLLANMIVYLTKEFNMPNVTASYILNLWSGTTNLSPLLGAFLSDSYIGRYWTIALGCIASLIGMSLLSLTAIFPQFRPPPCNPDTGTPCRLASGGQNALLYSSFIMMTIGAGGIRPCSVAFGADQFDYTSEKGKRSIQTFFNWYYFSFTIAVMVALTIIVYIQDDVSWSWGLCIPTSLMFLAITSFLLGAKLYIRVTPEGSSFTSFVQVLVAARRKCHLSLPSQTSEYYDPPQRGVLKSRMVLTDQFMCLNKASIKTQEDFKEDGSVANPWRLCSLQQVEELKSVIRIAPIWSSMISIFVCMAQLNTFSVLQAETMDRHIAKNFQIPAGSFGIFTMFALTLFLPIYDKFIVPFSRRITKEGRGITLLQRIGVGLGFVILSMAFAAAVETKRRNVALSHGFMEKPRGIIPMSALWLVPQYSVAGVAEVFSAIGQMEFLYSQFPENMRSVAGALFFLSLGLGNYLSSLIVGIVHKTTGGRGHHNWLAQNLNKAKLDNFYWLLAGYSAVNLGYFIISARWYRYKTTINDDQAAKTFITEEDNLTLPHA